MSSGPPKPVRAAFGPRWRRHVALRRAIERRIARRWLVRTGRITAYYICLSQGALVVWAGRAAPEVETSGLLARAATWITVAAGLVALGTTVDVRALLRADCLEPLLRQRGFSEAERTVAILGATAALTTRALFWPLSIVCVAFIGMSTTLSGALVRVVTTLSLLVYAPLAGALLAVISRWSVMLGTSRPRLLFVGVVVVPYVVASVGGTDISIVHLLGGMLDGTMRHVGGTG